MLSKRERILLYVFLGMAVFSSVVLLGKVLENQISVRRQKLSALTQRLSSYQRLLQNSDAVAAELEMLTLQQSQNAALIPESIDPYEFGIQVNNVYSQFSITVRRYRIIEPAENELPGVQAELAGELPDLLRLLEHIETDYPFWKISSLTISIEGSRAVARDFLMSIRIAYEYE